MEKLDCLKCGVCCFFGEKNANKKIGGENCIIVGTDGWCVHHDVETHKCKIYEKRPDNCRNFEKGGKDCLKKQRVIEKLRSLNLIEI